MQKSTNTWVALRTFEAVTRAKGQGWSDEEESASVLTSFSELFIYAFFYLASSVSVKNDHVKTSYVSRCNLR